MNNPQYCIIVDGSCDLIQAVSKSQQLDNVREKQDRPSVEHFLSAWFCRPGLVSLGSTVTCIKLPTLQRR